MILNCAVTCNRRLEGQALGRVSGILTKPELSVRAPPCRRCGQNAYVQMQSSLLPTLPGIAPRDSNFNQTAGVPTWIVSTKGFTLGP